MRGVWQALGVRSFICSKFTTLTMIQIYSRKRDHRSNKNFDGRVLNFAMMQY
jgi:hypothetical protein